MPCCFNKSDYWFTGPEVTAKVLRVPDANTRLKKLVANHQSTEIGPADGFPGTSDVRPRQPTLRIRRRQGFFASVPFLALSCRLRVHWIGNPRCSAMIAGLVQGGLAYHGDPTTVYPHCDGGPAVVNFSQ